MNILVSIFRRVFWCCTWEEEQQSQPLSSYSRNTTYRENPFQYRSADEIGCRMTLPRNAVQTHYTAHNTVPARCRDNSQYGHEAVLPLPPSVYTYSKINAMNAFSSEDSGSSHYYTAREALSHH
jgi:hypothetical protein